MKYVLTFFLLFISLSAYASNSLQEQCEKEFSSENPLILELINNDFKGYYDGGRSFYGYILYAIAENVNLKKETDLLYIKKIKLYWENAHNNQDIKKLQCIKIDDKNFKQLSDDTIHFITLYNSMCYKN